MAQNLQDDVANQNIYPEFREKSGVAAAKKHKDGLFIHPKVDSCDRCTHPFCVGDKSSDMDVL